MGRWARKIVGCDSAWVKKMVVKYGGAGAGAGAPKGEAGVGHGEDS